MVNFGPLAAEIDPVVCRVGKNHDLIKYLKNQIFFDLNGIF